MRGKSLFFHAGALADLLGRRPDKMIVDEIHDLPLREGRVIVIDDFTFANDRLIRHIVSRVHVDIPKCHAPVWPEKQYGKKYRRLLRSGKR